jgi:MoaA/NifB/PqqE/SkfB family radical SAM enzyme
MLKLLIKKITWNYYPLYKFLQFIFQTFKGSYYLKYYQTYPIELNLELTTYCNSRCSFCPRLQMLEQGFKELKMIDKELAKTVIRRFREITTENKVDEEKIKFNFVGLGEPILHPDFFEIVAYASELFPKALLTVNTNAIGLTPVIAEKLINSGLKLVVLSLCYFNKEDHKKYLGIDKYDKIIENIKYFLKIKKNYYPGSLIHIFNAPENLKILNKFYDFWKPYLNKNDNLTVFELSDNSFESKNLKKFPCIQIWSVIGVDYNGYAYPCCVGPMIKKDDDLCLGHITDSTKSLMNKLEIIRKNQMNGIYGVCDTCGNFYRDLKLNKNMYKKVMKYYKHEKYSLR